MRHNRRTKRFNRSYGERQAMLENMVTSLLIHQQIQTTLEKAKAAKRLADRMITLGKKDTLHSRRLAFSHLQDHVLTSKLFREVAPRFKSRVGGYTRILQLHRRKGDGAQMALLELTEKEIRVKEPKKAKKHQAPEAKAKEAPPAPSAKGGSASGGKQPEKSAKPKGGFFKNLGKFFRNKGGG